MMNEQEIIYTLNLMLNLDLENKTQVLGNKIILDANGKKISITAKQGGTNEN